MASFLEECKALLLSDQFERLQFLQMKANQFETNSYEDEEIQEIKAFVRKAINDRDRLKNLEFLKDESISLADILAVKKPTKKQLQDYIKATFQAEVKDNVTEAIAVIPYVFTSKTGTTTDKTCEIKMNARIENDSRLVSSAIQKMGIKGFIKNLTDFGKLWIMENHVSEAGPFAGKTIYPNVNAVALRFKFDKTELKKELKIKD